MPITQENPLKQVGEKAPASIVTIDDGSKLRLSQLYKEGDVLVYFYPRANTPGCTRQGCNLRDNMQALNRAGVQVVGVSKDNVEAQAKFKAQYKFNFPLVADTDRKLIDAFGVSARQSFLVRNGKIVWMQKKAKPDTQAEDALKAIAKLNS